MLLGRSSRDWFGFAFVEAESLNFCVAVDPSAKASVAAETTCAAYLRAVDAVVGRPPSSVDVGGVGSCAAGAGAGKREDASDVWQKFF